MRPMTFRQVLGVGLDHGSARLVVTIDPELGDLARAGDAKGLFDLHLHREAVGVPAEIVARPESPASSSSEARHL